MAERLRDAKTGRFVKTKKPPPLDPALVKNLRQGARMYRTWEAVNWEFVITEKIYVSREPPPEGEGDM